MPRDELTTREVAGRYRLDQEIGRGGAGVVWRGQDTLLRRTVAIKEVEPTQQRERVLREARAAARVSHPRLVTLFDVVEEDGRIFLVQELVSGGSLKDAIQRDGPLSPDRAAEVGEQLVAALEVLHREGIVHRDVKPGNVMITSGGDVKLGDLGIAAVAGDVDLTNTGLILGSPHYMPPEQATGERVDERADLWSLGATLFYAVEGHPPYEGPAMAAMTAIVHDPLPDMPSAGPLAPVIRRLLSKDPSQRPSLAETRRLLSGEPTAEYSRTQVAPVPAPPVRTEPTRRAAPASSAPPAASSSNKGWVAALIVVIALMAGGFALASTMDDGDDELTATSDDPTTETTAAPADEEEATTTEAPSTTGAPSTTAARAAAAGTKTYSDDEAGYSIAYPENWAVRDRSGNAVDLAEPETGTYLRIDWTDEPGDSAQAAWERQEASFSKEHEGYQRVRMEETTYQGHPASLWEYTYRERGQTLHAYNLGFVVGDERGFALNFQTREENWSSSQPTWEQLKANFTIES